MPSAYLRWSNEIKDGKKVFDAVLEQIVDFRYVCQASSTIVYNSANPSWPSNGNGNSFVLTVTPPAEVGRSSTLVITVWDCSQTTSDDEGMVLGPK